MRELIVDNFAGGGGASTGIEMALGRRVDIAINHDPEALALHAANHPGCRHLCESVWDFDPVEVTGGMPVGLAWFSPDCKHFSKAKGGRPVEKKIRGLAWVAVRWAATVRPRVIILENVEEFVTWGPLGPDGLPCQRRRGQTFRSFTRSLEDHGYRVEHRELRACDYGASTTRKRLFLVARRDGRPISWPEPTHGPGLVPFRTAAECIDWSFPCPSIFERVRPLRPATCRRIARGIVKFVLQAERPFMVTGPAAATMIQTGYGERPGQTPRALDIQEPLGTVVAGGSKHALVTAFLAKHYGGPAGNSTPGQDLLEPMATITSSGQMGPVSVRLEPPPGGSGARKVAAFLAKYYGEGLGQDLSSPLGTFTTRDRFGLVTVEIDGETYAISDIGLRMLQPRELYRAQGFPDSYQIESVAGGRPLTKTSQIRMVGNSVCPPLAAAIVLANCGEMAIDKGQGQLWEVAA